MFNVFISRTIRSNPFKHLTFDELEITTKSPLYLLDRSLFGTHILYYKGGEACSDVMTPLSSHTGPDNNSPAPHEARYRDPDQLCVAAPACWQCAPLSPRGLHTDAAFLIPDHVSSLCADTKVGAVAWCLQIFSSRWWETERMECRQCNGDMGKPGKAQRYTRGLGKFNWLLFYVTIIGLTKSKSSEAKVKTSERSFGSVYCQVSFVKYVGIWPTRGPIMYISPTRGDEWKHL